jgi:hypothetical protein
MLSDLIRVFRGNKQCQPVALGKLGVIGGSDHPIASSKPDEQGRGGPGDLADALPDWGTVINQRQVDDPVALQARKGARRGIGRGRGHWPVW